MLPTFMSVTNRRKTMKRWSFPVAVEAPCGECDKKPCGAYHDKCYAYKEFKAKMEKLKEKKIADKVIREERPDAGLTSKQTA